MFSVLVLGVCLLRLHCVFFSAGSVCDWCVYLGIFALVCGGRPVDVGSVSRQLWGGL